MSSYHQKLEILRFQGDLNVRNISESYKTICEILRQNDALALDLGRIDDCDLTAAQMIECARRSASRDGKTLTLATSPSAALLNVLERAALVGPDADPSDTFWLKPSGES